MHPGPAKRGGAGSLEDYGARVAASSGGGAASTSRCHACRVVLVSAYSKRARLCVECMRSEELEALGLKPHLMGDAMIDSLLSFAIKYKGRVDMQHLLPAVNWKEAGSATARVLKTKK